MINIAGVIDAANIGQAIAGGLLMAKQAYNSAAAAASVLRDAVFMTTAMLPDLSNGEMI